MTLRMELCKGRHEIPQATDGAIFENTIVDPTDVQGLYEHAVSVLGRDPKPERLVLYVTGMTVALVAVINACNVLGIRLALKHFNRDTGEYYTQHLWFNEEAY